MRAKLLSPRGSIRGIVVIAAILLSLFVLGPAPASAQAPAPGLAAGFEIEGNLFANNPGGIIAFGNDWLDGPAGPGTGVLFPDGTPKNGLTTLHVIDLIKNDDQDVFASSNKVFHDPNTYGWKSGSAPQKDDIQHGLVEMAVDGSGDHWMLVAGDRRSINGSSYIDFEFLQADLTRNPDGTFTSAGTDGGRTVGDILLTILLTKGGAQAGFFAQRWEAVEGGYTYVDIPIPPNTAFVAANIDSVVSTTYDAFGAMQYGVNQFGEAAVNLNQLLGSFDECFGIATVFIRTKSSASDDAELKDMIAPQSVNMCIDTEAPTIDCPDDVTISCTESIEPANTGIANGDDNCSSNLGINYADSVVTNGCGQAKTILRTWTATDGCGNTASCTQMITVVDNTAPVVTSSPQDVTIECGDQLPTPDENSVVATDDCGLVNVTYMGDVSDNQSCPETVTRTYRVSDECGNYVDVTQNITINDTTNPTVDPLSDIEIECSESIPTADTNIVSASDNCGSVKVDFVGDVSDNGDCPETITRTYRVTDDCGNTTDVTQKIIINDETPPTIEGPDDLTVACVADVPAPDTTLVSAQDNCSGVAVSYVGDQSDGNSCPQVITRTYRATDTCGNTKDFIQTITVDDDVDPTIISGPDDVTVDCVGAVPAADIKLINATDNCGGVTVAFVGDQSDTKSCPEVITRTYRATDTCGNSTDYVQTITVDDDSPPLVKCPAAVSVQCNDDIPAVNIASVEVTDNCGEYTVTHIGDVSDNQSCPETITRTYRVTDACGNYTDCSQTITVDDTTDPVVKSGPQDVTVACLDDVPPVNTGAVSATDNCSSVNVIHVGDESNGQTCPEIVTRTYRVSDDCGNTTDFVQIITVDDDTPPQLSSCGKDQKLECPDGFRFEPPTAVDDCDESPTVYVVDGDTTIGPEPWTFSMTTVWRAADACGNVSGTCSQTITAHCERDGLCTFTQGFWGNYGGKAMGVRTLDIIQDLLQTEMVIGKPGRSVTFNHKDAECIIQRLPAGKTPTTLPAGLGDASVNHNTCQTTPPLPVDSQGKYENVLLGQTIALTLNSRYDTWLWLFPLSDTFCTQAPGGDVKTYHIPDAVLDALDNIGQPPIVAGLIELCNRALAGWDTGGATLSQINNAADTINNAFDQCRNIVDCPKIAKSEDPERQIDTPTQYLLGQNYPNPFNPNTHIQFAVPEAADWTIDVYNVRGQLVRRFQGQTGGAAFVNVEWDGTDAQGRHVASGIYLYRARAGSFSAVKKMVMLK